MSREKAFNVLLAPNEMKQLNELAAKHGISRGAVLRQALSNRYAMELQGRPCCASGAPCFVAHLHPSTMNAANNNGPTQTAALPPELAPRQ
jgi:hypothetical protein